MKRLLALLLLVSTTVFAQQPYTIKTTKETVEIHQADGVVVTMPRAKPAIEVVDGEVVITTLITMHQKDQPGVHVLVLANMQKFCVAGKGALGVLTPAGVMVGTLQFDNKVNSPAKFAANFLCKQAGISEQGI